MQRNSQYSSGFKLSPVEDFTIFAGFTCLNPQDADQDLNNFIQHDAEQHYIDKIAVTYSLTHEVFPGDVLGFATLQNDAIIIDRESPLPEVAAYLYKAFPAAKIGRLGVSLNMHGLGLGALIIRLIKQLMCDANRTGCRFLTVDAWRNKKAGVDASPFYEKQGFHLLPCREKTSKYIPMYFDLKRFEAYTY